MQRRLVRRLSRSKNVTEEPSPPKSNKRKLTKSKSVSLANVVSVFSSFMYTFGSGLKKVKLKQFYSVKADITEGITFYTEQNFKKLKKKSDQGPSHGLC